MSVPRCLTIAGSDSGGGAGIQADLKAFAAAGCFGTSAIVAFTAQNTLGVTAVQELPTEFVEAELDAVFNDIGVDAAKTGMLFSRELIDTVADFLLRAPSPLVVDPVMVATPARSCSKTTPSTCWSTGCSARDGRHAEPDGGRGARGNGTRRELAERIHALGTPAVIVTGGHGVESVDHLFDGERHVEIEVERHDVAATHGAGCTHSATLAALLAKGLSLEDAARGAAQYSVRGCPERARRDRCRRRAGERPRIKAGADLAAIRERKPLVHQITNYVVMNETANATLALGALPSWRTRSKRSRRWPRSPGRSCSTSGRSPSTGSRRCCSRPSLRTRPACRWCSIPSGPERRGYAPRLRSASRQGRDRRRARERGRGRDPRRARGRDPRRRVDRGGRLRSGAGEGGRFGAGLCRVCHGPGRSVSDGARTIAVANGDALLGTVSGTGCMSSAITGCFLAVASTPLEAAAEALVAFGVAGEDAAVGAGARARSTLLSTTRSTTSTRQRSTRARRSKDEAARDRDRLRSRPSRGRGRGDRDPAAGSKVRRRET